MFYSKTTGGFYHPDIHQSIPSDAVEISDEEHTMLLASGRQIVATSSGHPVLSDKPGPVEVVRSDAVKLLTSGLAMILKSAAKAYNYASLEEVCSFVDGPFAEDGKFFRQLRDEMRFHLLGLIDKLADTQDMTEISALIQELRDVVKTKRQSFTPVTMGDANG